MPTCFFACISQRATVIAIFLIFLTPLLLFLWFRSNVANGIKPIYDPNPNLNPKFITPLSQSCPWVGSTHELGWVGLGCVEIFLIFGGLGRGSETAETQNLKIFMNTFIRQK